MRVILCVESNAKGQIDKKYIDNVIKHYYNMGTHKIDYVFMGGKFNYDNLKVVNEIQQKIITYQKITGEASKVIYCCDKDDSHLNHRDQRFIKALDAYCISNSYDLIWFVRNIEEVMTGEIVKPQHKSERVINFIRKNEVKTLKEKNLCHNQSVTRVSCTNMLSVLDKYLDR